MKIYLFKITNKYRKSIWRKIEIRENQTFGELDRLLRESFGYEDDHLSAFYSGNAFSLTEYGLIEPGGQGKGAKKKIKEMKLQQGSKLEYIYDMGESHISLVELLNIGEEQSGIVYPRVIEKNKRRNRYCEKCKLQGEKQVAIYNVYYFEEESYEQLCEPCMETIDEEFDATEIVY
ncbi:plasmid pRiA4b ORF-3 family protein [Paenibacillus xylanexedens]|uniref:plasmid pRiA4b ORF-3 family protein n=1 Tax=Paenibacillus xylanexedens TaxID=528191 RepID=UPI0011A62D22|nr:plasmid pRiA4b ORF-3 family protein [Paenibacillus xylanexedens]